MSNYWFIDSTSGIGETGYTGETGTTGSYPSGDWYLGGDTRPSAWCGDTSTGPSAWEYLNECWTKEEKMAFPYPCQIPMIKCGEKISKTKKTMRKLNGMMKRLLDPKIQTLVKRRFLDSELLLTASGRDALWGLIFETYKEDLVKLAEKDLAEEKEDK